MQRTSNERIDSSLESPNYVGYTLHIM
jgi:hypothetical protein